MLPQLVERILRNFVSGEFIRGREMLGILVSLSENSAFVGLAAIWNNISLLGEPLAEFVLTERALNMKFEEFQRLVLQNFFHKKFTTSSVLNVCLLQEEGRHFLTTWARLSRLQQYYCYRCWRSSLLSVLQGCAAW